MLTKQEIIEKREEIISVFTNKDFMFPKMDTISYAEPSITLSLDEIKKTISFSDKEHCKSWHGLVDVWYNKSIQEGKTKEEALNYTLDRLTTELLNEVKSFKK